LTSIHTPVLQEPVTTSLEVAGRRPSHGLAGLEFVFVNPPSTRLDDRASEAVRRKWRWHAQPLGPEAAAHQDVVPEIAEDRCRRYQAGRKRHLRCSAGGPILHFERGLELLDEPGMPLPSRWTAAR
jgi:hypothetical protein